MSGFRRRLLITKYHQIFCALSVLPLVSHHGQKATGIGGAGAGEDQTTISRKKRTVFEAPNFGPFVGLSADLLFFALLNPSPFCRLWTHPPAGHSIYVHKLLPKLMSLSQPLIEPLNAGTLEDERVQASHQLMFLFHSQRSQPSPEVSSLWKDKREDRGPSSELGAGEAPWTKTSDGRKDLGCERSQLKVCLLRDRNAVAAELSALSPGTAKLKPHILGRANAQSCCGIHHTPRPRILENYAIPAGFIDHPAPLLTPLSEVARPQFWTGSRENRALRVSKSIPLVLPGAGVVFWSLTTTPVIAFGIQFHHMGKSIHAREARAFRRWTIAEVIVRTDG
ncbi:hypothetical protein BDP27DRAFT_1372299 [Rhodocollybia butyracea]|uniref:Uncharacterized protein n=1 Tax=Rhodocollybia butyracea TaxID=206335 RepID=A0A9P5TXX6_9AGAR|nr:hypothetical protein BDP27DRAFT_1372299 [Rhodocollybia butyracea]